MCSVDGEERARDRRQIVAQRGGHTKDLGAACDGEGESKGVPLLDGQDTSSAELADAEESDRSVRSVVAFVHTSGEITMVAISSGLQAGGDTTYVQWCVEIMDVEE